MCKRETGFFIPFIAKENYLIDTFSSEIKRNFYRNPHFFLLLEFGLDFMEMRLRVNI